MRCITGGSTGAGDDTGTGKLDLLPNWLSFDLTVLGFMAGPQLLLVLKQLLAISYPSPFNWFSLFTVAFNLIWSSPKQRCLSWHVISIHVGEALTRA